MAPPTSPGSPSFHPATLKFEGEFEFAEEANKPARKEYRKEFELPKIG